MGDSFSIGRQGFKDMDKLINSMSRATSAFPRKMEKAMHDAGDIAQKHIARNFASHGSEFGNSWKPLHPLTQKDRKKKGFKPSRPILVRRGWLRASLTSKTSANAKREISSRGIKMYSTLKVKGGDNLFEIHQRGLGRVPARKMVREGSPPWVSASAWKEIEARFLGAFLEVRREMI